LIRRLKRPEVIRPIAAVLRLLPPLRIGRLVVLSRYDDVIEALTRVEDFGFQPAFTARVERVNAPFLLGMDWSARYQREASLLRQVIRPDDLPRIRAVVAQRAAELLGEARPAGQIDAVSGLARPVTVRLLAAFFGVVGPDEATMARWTSAIFNYLAAGGSPLTADRAAASLQARVRWLIGERKAAIARGEPAEDDALGRLLGLQGEDRPWLDDDTVTRNLTGLVIAAVEESTKAVVFAIDELLRRPAELGAASRAAAADDADTVRRYAFEALRFRPANPSVAPRRCLRATTLAQGRRLPEGVLVYVSTLSAMFDRHAFAEPSRFRVDRPMEAYLHFSYGRRACLGKAINGVLIPELVSALLRLPNLRRVPGPAGALMYDGVLPERLMLAFDPQPLNL
jgi:cytochrome P450